MKEEILRFYKDGDMLNKLIFINVVVFFVAGVMLGILSLFGAGAFVGNCKDLLMLRGDMSFTLIHPWTLVTYMFLHFEFIHFIMNMLMLHWFGRMFLSYYMQREVVGVYVLGGLLGAVSYLLAYTFSPMFDGVNGALCGASASVMAIIVALATTAPNHGVRLVLIGEVKMKWIAVVAIVFSLLNVSSLNAGGNISHLGGALAGYLYVYMLGKNKNITSWIGKCIDWCVNTVNRRKSMKFEWGGASHNNKTNSRTSDEEYNLRHKQEEADIDTILDKIKKNGYESLSKEEKERLFRASNRK